MNTLPIRAILICLAIFLFPGSALAAQPMKRCINVLGDDQEWFLPNGFFKPHHIDKIKSAGFDTIRLNLKAFPQMDASGNISRSWINSLHDLVNSATKSDLNVILDQHDFRSCGEDFKNCSQKLPVFWRQISKEFSASPDNVIFELHNEPNGQLTIERWNDMIPYLLKIVRSNNPHRKVIIGPGGWNSFSNIRHLALPPDPNLIVTFHYYNPLKFTHQGIPQIQSSRTIKEPTVTWGTSDEKTALGKYLDSIKKWSLDNKREILIGEFGVFSAAPSGSRIEWNSNLISGAEERSIGWCYYQFEGQFGIYSRSGESWLPDTGVIESLNSINNRIQR